MFELVVWMKICCDMLLLLLQLLFGVSVVSLFGGMYVFFCLEG